MNWSKVPQGTQGFHLTPAPTVGLKGRVISKEIDWWIWHIYSTEYSRTSESRASVQEEGCTGRSIGYRKKDKGGHSLASLIVWPQLVVPTAAQTVSEYGTLLEQAAGRQRGRERAQPSGWEPWTGWSDDLCMGSSLLSQLSCSGYTCCTSFSTLLVGSFR